MTLEHTISQYDGIGAGIAITDTHGDTHEPRAGMPKDQLSIYSEKLVDLCESVQGVKEDVLTPLRNAAAKVKDAIETANAEALGPAFSELMMRSVACMLVDGYRGLKAEKAQGSGAEELIRQLGRDYHTAASGYDKKGMRASFDDYIGETASGFGLDRTIVANVMSQAESIYEKRGKKEEKHEKKAERPRRFTGMKSIRDVARGKMTLGQSGAAYAGEEEPRKEPEVVFTADLKLESIAEQPDKSGTDMPEPDLEEVRRLTGMRDLVGARRPVESTAPEEEGTIEEHKEPPKPPEEGPSLVQRLEGQPLAGQSGGYESGTPTDKVDLEDISKGRANAREDLAPESSAEIYARLPEPPRKDTGWQRNKTSVTRTLPKGGDYSGRSSEIKRVPSKLGGKGRARKSARVTGVRYEPAPKRTALRLAKAAVWTVLAAGALYVALVLVDVYSPGSRQYLGPEKLGGIGSLIERSSKWIRGEK